MTRKPALATNSTIRVSARRFSFALAVNDEAAASVGDLVTSPNAAASVARAVIGSEISECVLAIFLDARHRVIGFAEVSRGTINASRLSPRDVLVPCLLANAGSVVVAHNHPSGDPSPSRADRVVTTALLQAAELVGVQLLDHVIVTPTRHFSFREQEGWGA